MYSFKTVAFFYITVVQIGPRVIVLDMVVLDFTNHRFYKDNILFWSVLDANWSDVIDIRNTCNYVQYLS